MCSDAHGKPRKTWTEKCCAGYRENLGKSALSRKKYNLEAMCKHKALRKRLSPAIFSLLLILVLLVSWMSAQETQQDKSPSSLAETARADQEHNKQQRISAQEAEQLFRSVDQILQFASKETLFPIKRDVKRRLVNREEVEAYISQHTREDEDAKRLRRSELVLKKFGLLPQDFDLGKFLVALLKEQVAGYYDPKTKTVNLLDWVGVEQQKPVLAHELTHALQDQSFSLEKYMKPGDLEKKKDITPLDIENDEISTARQAVVEGQAMAVLLDYMLAPMGESLKDTPEVVQTLKEGMLDGTPDSVQYQNAPIYLKEALTFPYRYGIDFITALLTHGGKEKAFTALFQNPPRTTRQIMEPRTYLQGEHLDPVPLPDFRKLLKDYDRFDVGAMGEFDVAILVDQYASTAASKQLFPHWRGGYYYAGRPKRDPKAPLALVYFSRWSNAERASEFGGIYARALPKRYLRVEDPPRRDGTQAPLVPFARLQNLTGKRAWLTEEGPVVIHVDGDSVLVTESLDGTATEALDQAAFRAMTQAYLPPPTNLPDQAATAGAR